MQQTFRHRLVMITATLVLLSLPLQAQQITGLVQQDKLSNTLEEATGLRILDSGRILLTSSHDGTLLIVDGEQVEQRSLKQSVFEDNDVSAIDVLNDSQWVLANSGDQQLAIIADDGRVILKFSRSGDEAGRLDEPVAIAVSQNGKIYVAEKDNNRISVFNDQGLFLKQLGNSGNDDIDINNPSHLALDASENLYVLKPGENFRITVYDVSGQLIRRIDQQELSPQFGAPLDISAMTADANGQLFLGDVNSRQIFSYDWQQRTIGYKFGSLGQSQGQYRDIALISVNRHSQLVVADRVNEKLEVYQLDKTDYAAPVITNTVRFAGSDQHSCQVAQPFIDQQTLCLRDNGIFVLDAAGEESGRFASEITEPITLHVGNEMVAILEHNKLHAYSKQGKKLYSLGRYGSAGGAFDGARFVYTAHNRVYVGDVGNNRIQVFAADGQFLNEIRASDNRYFQVGPLAVDSLGYIYVADKGSEGVIRKLDASNFNRIADIGRSRAEDHRVSAVYALDLDQQDRLYALVKSVNNPYAVRMYDQGELIEEFGAEGDYHGPMYFDEPQSLAVASTGKNTVIVSDPEQTRIIRFDYREIPEPAFGLRVAGNKQRVKLNWDSTGSRLIDHYRIEAAREQHGDYQALADSQSLEHEFTLDQVSDRPWFRVVAVSGLGVDSKPSVAHQNLFYPLLKLYQAGQFEQVIEMAGKLKKADPDNADILHLQAESELNLSQWQQALSSFRELESYPQYQKQAIKQQVKVYFELEQYLEARALIEPVLADQPKEVYPYQICARLSLKLNDAISAVTCAEDGLALFPEHAQLRYLLGKSYITAGIKDQGVLEFEQVLSSDSVPSDLVLQIADDLMQIELFEQALLHYEKLAGPPAQLSAARIGQARALLSLQRDDEARAIAVKLSASKDSRGEGYYILGKIAAKQGKHSEAVLRLSRASKLSPQNIDSWLSLASAYIEINKPLDAIKVLGQGMEANPEVFSLYEKAGELELAQENYAEANRYLEQAVQLDSQSYSALNSYARSLFATRDYRMAARYADMAARLAPRDVAVLTLQADIASQQGKLGDAIEYLKTAIDLQPASAELQLQIGKIYQHANLFDASRTHLEKAASINPAWAEPLVALGHLFSKRRQFDEAIKLFEQAVQLEPSDNNRALLNSAFADKKKSLEFDNNTPQLLLSDLNLKQVFSAAYKQYADQSIGSVTLKNASATDYGNLQLSFQIKEYMDFPVLQEIPSIKGNETQQFDFKVTFNNKILEVDEDIGVQVEVKLTYQRDGQKDDIRLTQPMTIYGKNAMVWGQAEMVGSFVTPKDDTLRNYVRAVINQYQPEVGPLNDKMVSAMTFFSALNAAGTRYIVDPNTPYNSLRDDQVDYVQFPRETLKLKSGDCDDLSVLLSAGLENLGIETVLLEVPGHLLMMFNTGLPENDAGLISQDSSLLAFRDGQVWIPLESTMVNASFNEAWAEGARKYQQALQNDELGIIDLKKAWQQYKPVTLRKADFAIDMPDQKQTLAQVERAQNQLLSRSISRLILPYQSLIKNNPRNIDARLQIAILYSRYGLVDEAQRVFDALHEIAPDNSAIHNNQGNLHLLQKQPDQAVASYLKAAALDDRDGGIQVNLSMAYYQKGDMAKASSHFAKALELDANIKAEYSAYQKLLNQ